jgi:hypothetical protein
MKKFLVIIVLGLLLTSNLFAKNIHLKCEYGDGSGAEHIFIDKEKGFVKWSNEDDEKQYELFKNLSPAQGDYKYIAFAENEVHSLLQRSYIEVPKDIHFYSIDFKSIEIDLFEIKYNNSNKATIDWTQKTVYLYVDEKNKERIFMPTWEKLKNTTRGKYYYTRQLGTAKTFSGKLNCLKN